MLHFVCLLQMKIDWLIPLSHWQILWMICVFHVWRNWQQLKRSNSAIWRKMEFYCPIFIAFLFDRYGVVPCVLWKVNKRMGVGGDSILMWNRDLWCICFNLQINLAIAYEMILQESNALECFNVASSLLEDTLSRIAKANESVIWLDRIASNPCTSWDYPTLTETNRSWKVINLYSLHGLL